MEKVRLGIIGFGNIGSAHAHSIVSGNIHGLELTAVCDIDQEKRKQAGTLTSMIAFFASYEDLLNSGLVDAVLIATPHYLHPIIGVKAFEKGLHVLTEKPAGVYTRQVEQMNEAARQSGKVFGIMFNQRTNILFQRAREIVRGGCLGQPKRMVWIITNWYRTQAYYNSGGWRATWAGEGGGVLLNQAPHNLDLWQWVFGMPKRVRAFCSVGKYHQIEVEDDATIYAEYENGAVATFITSTGEYPGTNRIEITGDQAKLLIEDGKLRLWKLGTPEREFCYLADKGFDEPQITYEEYQPDKKETAHAGILQNFTDAILKGTDLLAPGIEGINELAISNAAYLSAWMDDWVSLPVDGDAFLAQLQQRVALSKQKDNIKCEKISSGVYNTRWNIRW